MECNIKKIMKNRKESKPPVFNHYLMVFAGSSILYLKQASYLVGALGFDMPYKTNIPRVVNKKQINLQNTLLIIF